MSLDSLIFCSGGTKGISYLGCIKYLMERDKLNDFNEYGGVSVGSIFALIALLGTQNEYSKIYDYVMNIDISKYGNDIDYLAFVNYFGINLGIKVYESIIEIIKHFSGLTNPTFKELYEKYNKKLDIISYCLNDICQCHFNYITEPDMKVSVAIRASISIPIYFSPVFYKDKYFIDGAYSNIFPIINDKEKIPTTLLIGFENNNTNKNTKINNFEDYLYWMLKAIRYDKDNSKKYSGYNIIKISNLDKKISLVDFNITKKSKDMIIKGGYEIVSTFYNENT